MQGIKRFHIIATVATLALMCALLIAILQPASAAPGRGSNAETNSGFIPGSVIPGSYIVVFKDGVKNPHAVANEMARNHGLALDQEYDTALKGFAAVIPAGRLKHLNDDPRVEFISEDRVLSITESAAAKPVPDPSPPPFQPPITPVGISRMGLNETNKGTGIGVAVFDTGIDLDHPDLAGNIVADYTAVKGTSSGDDDHGHGTHVAGTVAAIDNAFGVIGVAPEAKLIAVKVLNKKGMGSTSQIIAGVDWVTKNAATYNIKVANMSLAGPGRSDNNCGNTDRDAVHKAICASTAAGVTYVVAAGNEHKDASKFTPAAFDDTVITVSAIRDSDGLPGGLGEPFPLWHYLIADDTFADFSNYGSTVDLGAQGVGVASTFIDGRYAGMSGTSMASPHVAGAAALYLHSHPGSSWQQVRDGLTSVAEPLNFGHTDPSGLHPEPVVLAGEL